MPALIAPLASSVLSGPITSIVGGVVSSLAGGIGGAQGAKGNSPLGGIFSFASNLIGGLFGQKPGGGLRPPTGFPSPFQLPQSIFQNLGNALQGLSGAVNNASQGLGGILAILQKVLGGQQQTGQAGQTPFFPGIIPNQGSGTPRPDYSRLLNEKADSLMSKARVLSNSDNPADKLKAQMLTQAAQSLRNGAADPGFRVQNPAAQSLLNQAFNLMQSDNPADKLKAQMLLQKAQGMGQQGPVDPAFRYDRGTSVISDAKQDGRVSGQGLDATIDRVGNKAQSLMDQAEGLAASDNPADQMKAQRIMQQAQRMMEFMSGMIKIIGDMQKNAIQNMR